MKRSPNGFVPARGFLESGMAPRPSFNDGSNCGDIVVVVDDGNEVSHRSLRTPISTYQKHVRYAVFEFEELLDSSSIDAGTYIVGVFLPYLGPYLEPQKHSGSKIMLLPPRLVSLIQGSCLKKEILTLKCA